MGPVISGAPAAVVWRRIRSSTSAARCGIGAQEDAVVTIQSRNRIHFNLCARVRRLDIDTKPTAIRAASPVHPAGGGARQRARRLYKTNEEPFQAVRRGAMCYDARRCRSCRSCLAAAGLLGRLAHRIAAATLSGFSRCTISRSLQSRNWPLAVAATRPGTDQRPGRCWRRRRRPESFWATDTWDRVRRLPGGRTSCAEAGLRGTCCHRTLTSCGSCATSEGGRPPGRPHRCCVPSWLRRTSAA